MCFITIIIVFSEWETFFKCFVQFVDYFVSEFLISGKFFELLSTIITNLLQTKSKPQHWIVVNFISNDSKTSNRLWNLCSEYEGVGIPILIIIQCYHIARHPTLTCTHFFIQYHFDTHAVHTILEKLDKIHFTWSDIQEINKTRNKISKHEHAP